MTVARYRLPVIAMAVLAGLVSAQGQAQVAPAAPPAAASPPAAPQVPPVATLDELDSRLRDLTAQDRFSGVMLVARGDNVLFSRAYGQASREYGAANGIDTRFSMASASKMFTATAIMMLAERGRLSLSDPIGRYLGADWIADPHIRETVTIEQLLTHTSGLGNFLDRMYFAGPRVRFVELDDYKPIIADSTLAFEPGTRWEYSNVGYLLLGIIVQAASGSDYYQFVQSNIFDPLGMTHTGAVDLQEVVPGIAQGYTHMVGPRTPPAPGQPPAEPVRVDGPWRNNVLISVVKGGPAGGLYSTAPDLLRFVNALAAGRLVSAESFRRMTTPKPASPTYGYAMRLNDGGYGHSGGFPGVSTNIRFYPDGTRVIILSNLDGGAVLPFEMFRTLPDFAP